MKHLLRVLVLAMLALVPLPTAALAHGGNPNFRSVVHGFSPPVPGLSIEVIGYDAYMQLTNHSGKAVTIYGYDGEPYARILADGTVQTNQHSPALFLNQDYFAQVQVPPSANANLPPAWKTLDKSGVFVWHDHRMHWMSPVTPPEVKDKGKKTKIFDYKIPLRVANKPDHIAGTLYWVGSPGGFPVAAIISLILIAILGIGGALYLRRRRGANPQETTERPQETAEEAW